MLGNWNSNKKTSQTRGLRGFISTVIRTSYFGCYHPNQGSVNSLRWRFAKQILPPIDRFLFCFCSSLLTCYFYYLLAICKAIYRIPHLASIALHYWSFNTFISYCYKFILHSSIAFSPKWMGWDKIRFSSGSLSCIFALGSWLVVSWGILILHIPQFITQLDM